MTSPTKRAYNIGAQHCAADLDRSSNPFTEETLREAFDSGYSEEMGHQRALQREALADRYGDAAAD